MSRGTGRLSRSSSAASGTSSACANRRTVSRSATCSSERLKSISTPRVNRPVNNGMREKRARVNAQFCQAAMRGWSRSVAGQDAIDQLLHRWHEAVRIERIGAEIISGMPCEHQVLVRVVAVRDVLQRLLDAEAARIGEITGRVVVMVLPRRERAMRQTAHAIGLVLADFGAFLGGHEDQRVVRRLERGGKALCIPAARAIKISRRHPEILALHSTIELCG